MNRSDHERLVAEISEDASDDSAWEDDPSPATPQHQPRLGAQVTIRLEPELAKELRRIAERRGVRYTALVRQWLEERLREEGAMSLSAPHIEIAVAGFTDSNAVSKNQTVTLRLAGPGRLVPTLA
jgi:predicted DNA binding CopG/RHH family protein